MTRRSEIAQRWHRVGIAMKLLAVLAAIAAGLVTLDAGPLTAALATGGALAFGWLVGLLVQHVAELTERVEALEEHAIAQEPPGEVPASGEEQAATADDEAEPGEDAPPEPDA